MLGACTVSPLTLTSYPCFPYGEGSFYTPLHYLISLCSVLTVDKSSLPQVCLFINAVFSAIKVFQECGGGDLLGLITRGILP